MVKFPSFLLCSALAAFALFLVVDARLLGCKGGLDCLNPEMASSPKYKDEKVSAVPPELAKGVKPSEGGRSARVRTRYITMATLRSHRPLELWFFS
ncbi:uncharacterized protein A4U43_C09F1270 [Asparagus officinalis]|uniref:Uncharacterized protein n=1 Tax=Asparagus officinalis TaxID=4686 RepID=A0A5P1E696_ASPOF|nr:uncharacterized protein A4U43_C09F1270 [Asparagus officinalis]